MVIGILKKKVKKLKLPFIRLGLRFRVEGFGWGDTSLQRKQHAVMPFCFGFPRTSFEP